jgi:hypothetical protein
MESDADNTPPSISVRWFRPTMSTPFLQLPTAPISVTNIDSWIALSIQESVQCEEAWHALSDEQRHAAEASSSEDNQPEPLEELAEEESTVGVTLSEDRLFEVDVKSMEASYSLTNLKTDLLKYGVVATNLLAIEKSSHQSKTGCMDVRSSQCVFTA